MKASGFSSAVARSSWRRKRLLILCYHGIATQDEHQWRPTLYMPPGALAERFRIIRESRATVLPLAEAVRRLYAGTLPEKAVAITFDDGGYDFYLSAYPIVREFGFPVTVYQTTYYSDFQKPIFNLACSYMLWKTKSTTVAAAPQLGIMREQSLPADRDTILHAVLNFAEDRNLGGAAKDEVAAQLAAHLGFDYDIFHSTRLFHLMTPDEIVELHGKGVDFQLHTHRHRTPEEQTLFRKEISDNRRRLEQITGQAAVHFCYPSGVYREQFLRWLHLEGVESATTCEASLAGRSDAPLLLPRLVDTVFKSAFEFEGWLEGTGSLLARGPASRRIRYTVAAGTESSIPSSISSGSRN
jgi:peptidoglycan/xylan/chitin deacetylase (PgdA/CDA1 family)